MVQMNNFVTDRHEVQKISIKQPQSGCLGRHTSRNDLAGEACLYIYIFIYMYMFVSPELIEEPGRFRKLILYKLCIKDTDRLVTPDL